MRKIRYSIPIIWWSPLAPPPKYIYIYICMYRNLTSIKDRPTKGFPEDPALMWCVLMLLVKTEDQVVVSSDYDSTHEANHSDSSDVAHTEEDTEEGKKTSQNVILHPLIPPEVRREAIKTPSMALRATSVDNAVFLSWTNSSFSSCVTCTGQTDSGPRAAINGRFRADDGSAQ